MCGEQTHGPGCCDEKFDMSNNYTLILNIMQVKFAFFLIGRTSLTKTWVCKVFVTNIIVRQVERSETHSRQFSDPPGPVGAVS